MESCDQMDTLMVEKSKLDKYPKGKAVDPTRYCGMIGSLMYLASSRPYLVFVLLQMLIMLVAKIPEEVHLGIPFHQGVSGKRYGRALLRQNRISADRHLYQGIEIRKT
nr:retrovirus-related Pol polyprotein from transposon TNT 1-94 [Tanacetum cinerariifolium]